MNRELKRSILELCDTYGLNIEDYILDRRLKILDLWLDLVKNMTEEEIQISYRSFKQHGWEKNKTLRPLWFLMIKAKSEKLAGDSLIKIDIYDIPDLEPKFSFSVESGFPENPRLILNPEFFENESEMLRLLSNSISRWNDVISKSLEQRRVMHSFVTESTGGSKS